MLEHVCEFELEGPTADCTALQCRFAVEDDGLEANSMEEPLGLKRNILEERPWELISQGISCRT